MKRVNILIDNSRIVDYHIFPLRVCKKRLLERGYTISFHSVLNERFFNCEYIVFLSKPLLTFLREKNPVIPESSAIVAALRKARLYSDKIIWMDTSDSTSVTHFELLPYVDLYLKKQLLRDRSLYSREFIGGRIFTDFYNREFSVSDTSPFIQFYPLQERYLNKVDLSWNIGLGLMYHAFSFVNSLRRYAPFFYPCRYTTRFTSPDVPRISDFFIRTTSNLDRNLIAFHRQELLRQLDSILLKCKLIGSTKGPWLSKSEFENELKHTKIVPSPFGWGEIGVRDYEAFIFGATLLKPDVSHMETWPDIFIPKETYQPFCWDFSDLESRIMELLNNENTRLKIAKNGQEAYRHTISSEGLSGFCDWFITRINGQSSVNEK